MSQWTPEREAEIEARLAAATPRPWRSNGYDHVPRAHDLAVRNTRLTVVGKPDAELLVHAAEDLADLLEELRAERERAEAWRELARALAALRDGEDGAAGRVELATDRLRNLGEQP